MYALSRPLFVAGSFTFAAALVAGCETNPVTGPSQGMIVSEGQAQSASAQAYAKTVSQARSQRKLDSDTARTARVQQITSRLVPQGVPDVPESAGW